MEITVPELFGADHLSAGLTGRLETGRILLVPLSGPPTPVYSAIAGALAAGSDSRAFTLTEADAEGGSLTEIDPETIATGGGTPDWGEDGDGLQHQPSPAIGRSTPSHVVEAVRTHDIDLVAAQCGGGIESARQIRRPLAERIAAAVPCDAVVVNGSTRVEQIASILLPIAGGPHSGVAADVAKMLSMQEDAWVDILTIDDGTIGNGPKGPRTLLNNATQRLAELESVDTWLIESDDVPSTIVEQSRYYDLTVLGAPAKGRLKQFIFGSTTHEIRTGIDSAALMVRNFDG